MTIPLWYVILWGISTVLCIFGYRARLLRLVRSKCIRKTDDNGRVTYEIATKGDLVKEMLKATWVSFWPGINTIAAVYFLFVVSEHYSSWWDEPL